MVAKLPKSVVRRGEKKVVKTYTKVRTVVKEARDEGVVFGCAPHGVRAGVVGGDISPMHR